MNQLITFCILYYNNKKKKKKEKEKEEEKEKRKEKKAVNVRTFKT